MQVIVASTRNQFQYPFKNILIYLGDPSITENEWSLIMEDDAILSENVTSIAAMDVVSRSLAEIDQRRARSPTPLQHGFAYFGMCRGDCTVNFRFSPGCLLILICHQHQRIIEPSSY